MRREELSEIKSANIGSGNCSIITSHLDGLRRWWEQRRVNNATSGDAAGYTAADDHIILDSSGRRGRDAIFNQVYGYGWNGAVEVVTRILLRTVGNVECGYRRNERDAQQLWRKSRHRGCCDGFVDPCEN